MAKAKIFRFALYTLFVFILSCSKDDSDGPSGGGGFYGGADTSASTAKLVGYWAIFSAEYNGEEVGIPVSYENCGRDFFVYWENGDYEEYVFQHTGCETEKNSLKWSLDGGVVTLSTDFGQSDELVITKLTDQDLIFKARVDVDEDGELDIFLLHAKRYRPNEKDLISLSFRENSDEAFDDLLSFVWEPYDGFNTFEKYEIYRSSGENCSKSNAELIATITDQSVTEFTDLTPPSAERLCYYIKIYTDQGVLGESGLREEPTQFIRIDPVTMHEPTVSGNSIELNWAASTSPYFSHYEILLSNESAASSAFYDQEQVLAIIDDKDLNTYLDDNPPYLENPVYAVRAYNIFGNYSQLYSNEVTSFWEVPFKRNEILPFYEIYSFAVDTAEPILYFYGRAIEDGVARIRLLRYNYDTQQIEAVSNFVPDVSSDKPIQVVNGLNGKEVVLHQGSELHFYNASTMEYKYAVDPEGVVNFSSFGYNNFWEVWFIVDHNEVYTMERDNANLFLIDQTPHYDPRPGLSGYGVIELKNGQILMGHSLATNSFLYTIDDPGNIQEIESVDIHFRWWYDNEYLLYNSTADILMDTAQNRLYSSLTFQFLNSFEEPYFSTGLSTDGIKIFGTNNDPEWNIDPESPHKKEAIVYDRNSLSSSKYETIGYPHFIFENFDGDIFSISSGFKKDNLYQNMNNKADIFVEKVITP